MNIAEEVSFDKDGRVENNPLWKRLYLSLVIILIASLSFGIGRLTSTGNQNPIKIEYDESLSSVPTQTASAITATKPSTSVATVVASKSGSKYHFLHCPGAKQIKEANKLTFPNPAAAEAAGYSLAANCMAR